MPITFQCIKRVRKEPERVKIYGIQRDITSSSPEWTRTNDAVGMSATASVGDIAGRSDFDGVMPWKGIVRETLSTGDVMVKIPKFYFRRYREGNIEHIEITDAKLEGFEIHPAFNHGNIENSCIFIGAYKTSNNNKSISGEKPQRGQTRATARTLAKNKGRNWGILDVSTLSAIQMLYLTEFANNNTQEIIGQGINNFSGSSLLISGKCDTIPNLTGRLIDTGSTPIVYRGIENLWGGVYEPLDGVNYNGSTIYICNDPQKYSENTSKDYTQLLYSFPSFSETSLVITELGLDQYNSSVMLPTKGTGENVANAQNYYTDNCITAPLGEWAVPYVSGSIGDGYSVGLFLNYAFTPSEEQDTALMNFFGSRLLYLPPAESGGQSSVGQ